VDPDPAFLFSADPDPDPVFNINVDPVLIRIVLLLFIKVVGIFDHWSVGPPRAPF